jgi:hypothetical protein
MLRIALDSSDSESREESEEDDLDGRKESKSSGERLFSNLRQ